MPPIILALALLSQPHTCGNWAEGYRSSRAERAEAKRDVDRTAKAMGASRDARKVLLGMAARESRFDTCAMHTLGENELGRGVFGLSVRWVLHIWDRWASPEALHSPIVSTIVTLRILRRAVRRFGASSWVEAHSVFASGRVKSRPVLDRKFCALLERHNVDCTDSPAGQLGRKLGITPTNEQYAFLEELQK